MLPRFKKSQKYRLAVGVVKTLHKAGHSAYLVGGCVRDLLRGIPPKDFDIATAARPEQIAKLFPRTIPVGAQFGVMLVLQKKIPFEVATFRTDLPYKDGRHPEGIVFSTPRQDALRRDFTVNGLFYDPLRNRIIDYVQGQKDLKLKRIRAIGNPLKRFEEDRLRILRAVRFAATLGFEVEPKTWEAVVSTAKEITQVSHERIRDELVKLFQAAHPERGLDLLDQTGLLQILLPEVVRMKGVAQPPEFHPEGDVYIHTRMVLSKLKNPSPILALSALFHDVGKPPTFKIADRIRFDGHDRVGADITQRILRRFRFSNVEIDRVCEIVADHMRFKDVQKMRLSTLKRFMSKPTFPEQLKLHRVDCLSSHGDLSNWHFLQKKLKELPQEVLKPKSLVTGHDLIALGFSQGPIIGRILKAVEDQQLEGELKSSDQALEWVGQHFKPESRASE